MARFKFKFNKQVNIGRVITKIVVTILALWVGGEIVTNVAQVMNLSSSPFFKGLSLIGFNELPNNLTATASTETIGEGYLYCTTRLATTCLDGTIDSTGLLSVVGLVAVASIVMEFVQIRLG